MSLLLCLGVVAWAVVSRSTSYLVYLDDEQVEASAVQQAHIPQSSGEEESDIESVDSLAQELETLISEV